MFCLYCGYKLPEDSAFCSRCGKRQNTDDREKTKDVAILPLPQFPGNVLQNGVPASNVPVVQGTPSLPGIPSVQNTPFSAPNMMPLTPSALRQPQTPPSELLHGGQHFSPRPVAHGSIQTPPTTPALPGENHYLPSQGTKLAGKISRRAVMKAAAGAAGLAVVGGGIVLLTHGGSNPFSGSTTPDR